MARPISELYSVLYELTRKLTHLKPSCSNPLRFTSFCPIHGKEKISDVSYWIDNPDSTDIHVRCKVCGDLSIDDILNPKPKSVAVITDSLALIEEFNFDYSGIDAADEIKAATSRIKARWKRVGKDLIEVGKELNAVKDRLPHGQFLPWLQAEFELSQRTANDLMNVATRFEGKSANIADLNSTVLYLLAAPSTPDEVVDLALETAAKGETVSVAKVKTWKGTSGKSGKVKPRQAEPVKPEPVETATPVNKELPKPVNDENEPTGNSPVDLESVIAENEKLKCEIAYLKSKLRDVYENRASLRLDADDVIRFDSLPE